MTSIFSFKTILLLCAALLALSTPASSQEAAGSPQAESSAPTAPLFGVWENSSRFVEISPEGRMRVILKPYYAFVYEDEGWIRCRVLQESGFGGGAVYALSVSYPGQRAAQDIFAAVIEGESLYTGFFAREGEEAAFAFGGQAAGIAGEATAAENLAQGLEGFWVYYGSDDGIMLYGKPPADELFCLYFEGSRYYKIRYWRTDARFADLRAVFPDSSGENELSIPKFLWRGDCLYTCVTGTGKTLRNYEQGDWELLDGEISFFADKIVFAGSLQSETLPIRLFEGGEVLLLGEPQLARAEISDMDAAIAERNSTRRPQRKPPIDFMDLDFHWDEIERLRQ